MNKSILIISLVTLFFFTACNPKQEVAVKEEGTYKVTSPLILDTSTVKDYIAEIQSIQNIEVRAKVKGYLESIAVDEGQLVTEGQTLFTIRSREFDAELAKAQAEVKTNELEMENVKSLADKNIVSQTELGLAIAKLNEAKAQQGIAETNLSFTRITAPFSGTVDRLKFKVGSLIDEGCMLTTLSNNKSVYAYFNVSEKEYLDFKSRSKNDARNTVSLLLANGQMHKYKGIIETIEGEFDKNTGNIAFRAKFPNPDLLLKHGETGKVLMTVDLPHALLIPQKATYDLQDKTYVYVLGENNTLRSKSITIHQRLSNLYDIGSSLSPTDKILLEGIQNVKDDDKITPQFVPAREVLDHLELIKQ